MSENFSGNANSFKILLKKAHTLLCSKWGIHIYIVVDVLSDEFIVTNHLQKSHLSKDILLVTFRFIRKLKKPILNLKCEKF